MVLAIMGVLAAIATPRISGSMSRARAQSAAKRVAADIEFARSTAIASSASRRVVFSPTRAAYVIPGATSPLNPGSALYSVRLSQPPYQATMAAVSFGDDSARSYATAFDADPIGEIVFDGFGTPDTAGWITLKCGDHYFKVTMDTAGRTSVTQVPVATLNSDIASATAGVVAVLEEKIE